MYVVSDCALPETPPMPLCSQSKAYMYMYMSADRVHVVAGHCSARPIPATPTRSPCYISRLLQDIVTSPLVAGNVAHSRISTAGCDHHVHA
jgi:hypothetical protein